VFGRSAIFPFLGGDIHTKETYWDKRNLLRQTETIQNQKVSVVSFVCLGIQKRPLRSTKETTETSERDYWDILKRPLRHTKETTETYKRDHWEVQKRPLRQTLNHKSWTLNPEPWTLNLYVSVVSFVCLSGFFCMSRHTKETTETYKRDHWDTQKRPLRHLKETTETY